MPRWFLGHEILRLRAQNDTTFALRFRISRERYGVGVAASATGSNV